jgi:glucose/mannose transport system substrate-binding protein
MNDLFYNVQVLEDAGVDPDGIDSFDAWVDALDAVESETDATPYVNTMASWTVLQFWAVIMLGTQGYDAYMNFIEGNGDESAVRAAFDNAEVVLSEYINGDAPEIGFTEANQRLMAGDGAFIHQGNWVAGAYGNEDLTFGEDWGRIQFPGTENMYGLHFDSFLYPANNPTPDSTHTWMRFAGSETAHIEFNRLKGSIPTRDVPTDRFNDYLTETIEDFANAERRPPTIAHGLAVPQATQSELESAISDHFADPFSAGSVTSAFMDIV